MLCAGYHGRRRAPAIGRGSWMSVDDGGSRNLAWRLAEHLGQAIVTGRIPEGSLLPVESALCTEYDVGRGAVREAIKILSAKGLVEPRPRRGTRVNESRRWNLLDPEVLGWMRGGAPRPALLEQFLQVRKAIEPEAAALAASCGDPDGIARIRAAYRRMEAAAVGEDDPQASDAAFHCEILAASGNPFFAALQPMVGSALSLSIRATNAAKGVEIADLEAHRGILDAIVQGRAPLARRRVRELLDEVEVLIAPAPAEPTAAPARGRRGTASV